MHSVVRYCYGIKSNNSTKRYRYSHSSRLCIALGRFLLRSKNCSSINVIYELFDDCDFDAVTRLLRWWNELFLWQVLVFQIWNPIWFTSNTDSVPMTCIQGRRSLPLRILVRHATVTGYICMLRVWIIIRWKIQCTRTSMLDRWTLVPNCDILTSWRKRSGQEYTF